MDHLRWFSTPNEHMGHISNPNLSGVYIFVEVSFYIGLYMAGEIIFLI